MARGEGSVAWVLVPPGASEGRTYDSLRESVRP